MSVSTLSLYSSEQDQEYPYIYHCPSKPTIAGADMIVRQLITSIKINICNSSALKIIFVSSMNLSLR